MKKKIIIIICVNIVFAIIAAFCVDFYNQQKIIINRENKIAELSDNIKFKKLNEDSINANSKITQEQVEQIVIEYLVDNPEDYNELKEGYFLGTCYFELNEDNLKKHWRIEFEQFGGTGSYMIIDAESGEIVKKYFFSGTIIN